MKMKKEDVTRSLGGIIVMSSTFLFLYFVGYNFKDFSSNLTTGIETIKGSQGEKAIKTTLLTSNEEFLPVENLEKGSFNLKKAGDLVEKSNHQETPIFSHYRAIQSNKLGEFGDDPELKVEIISEPNTIAWINMDIYKIDRNRNIIFFPFKTVENGTDIFKYTFTGNYQLIFN